MRAELGAFLPPPTLEAVVLCVSELVTNALDHGTPPYQLGIIDDNGGVRVDVGDGSVVRPVVRALVQGAERGRGMYLVENLASEWGVDERRDGKTVWVRFAP